MGRFAIALLLGSLAGCVTMKKQLPTYEIDGQFETDLAKSLMTEGPNTIRGGAFMRQRGGGVVTCAGQYVRLIPSTEYARRRMAALYNSGDSGSNQGREFKFVPDWPDYYTYTKVVKCDAQGNFAFEKVADGAFFVVAQITWEVGGNTQGGNLMQWVKVSGGSTATATLSP